MALTITQLRFLAERLTSESDTEAAKRVGIHETTPAKWKGNNPDFAARYAKVFEDGVDLAIQIMREHLAAAALTLAENLKATGENGPDYAARNQAAKTLLQSHGLIRDRQDVNVSGGLTMEAALSALDARRSQQTRTDS